MPRNRATNLRLAELISGALARDGISAMEAGKRTGLGHAAIGRMKRGERKGLTGHEVEKLAEWLSMTRAQLYEAIGYKVPVSSPSWLPDDLVKLWPKLTEDAKDGVLKLVRAAANPTPGEAQ